MDTVLDIFSEGLGAGCIRKEDVVAGMENSGSDGLFVQAAFMKDRMVGVQTVKVLTNQEIHTFQVEVEKYGEACTLESSAVGMPASLAVSRAWRRKGIRPQLIQGEIQLLREKGCMACVAPVMGVR